MAVLIVLLYCAGVLRTGNCRWSLGRQRIAWTELIKIDRTCARTPMASNDIGTPTDWRKRQPLPIAACAQSCGLVPLGVRMRLRKPRAQGKPIFLSIGYSTCHWCHVMEARSFENPEIAGILNDKFVSIKVWSEERPDIGQRLHGVVQAATGGGAGPWALWLTPEPKPVWRRNLFPTEDRQGISALECAAAIASAWQKKSRGN